MAVVGGKWDGKGSPPSMQAAIDWLIAQGYPKDDAPDVVKGRGNSSLRAAGTRARSTIAGFEKRKGTPAPKATASPDAGVTVAYDSKGNVSGAVDSAGQPLAANDLNTLIAQGPGGFLGGGGHGDPIWPYDVSGLADGGTGLKVQNRSRISGTVNGVAPDVTGMVGARYFADSALAPLSWSPEKRADVQRLMLNLGLYGKAKVTLGDWTETDQKTFGAVLGQSNVRGTRWAETLADWRRGGVPPEVSGSTSGQQSGTIQVTNPLDIQQAAEKTSRDLLGRVDRPTVDGVVAPYQAAEAGAQGAVIADQSGGGGGTTAAAPSVGAFAEQKIRQEKPVEVDSYQFLGQFQNLLQTMGVS